MFCFLFDLMFNLRRQGLIFSVNFHNLLHLINCNAVIVDPGFTLLDSLNSGMNYPL